ncbi:LysR family transcriptional regulator [Thalassotalea agarivorans]|uniref:DNA-binding transcriptional regulator, LysR family n=1 Tax=Thalassotalea agarivorans TaxID=349064 RepID=A0A1I0G8I4_THASX|nr:LysR family transcriptional regulator [Thalassotalea agarivorans]SET67139.1 DNA-binding transcriptional regulator, LysR family [Thalassotalea agarivorans]
MYNYRQLARADLNLLVAFQMLMEEGSVSGAANKAFVSQSAMSRTLQRLRELFDEQLFVRQSHGLIPTQRATDLYMQLQPLLTGIDRVLDPVSFDPAQLNAQFVIACPSLLSSLWLPGLIGRLAESAPGVKLRSIEAVENPTKLLTTSTADLVVHSADFDSKSLSSTPLPDATTLCLVRKGHPLTQQKMTLKRFLSYPHLRYFIPGLHTDDQGLIDYHLSRLGLQREIRYDGHDMQTLLQITKDSNCIFSLASTAATLKQAADWQGIALLQSPPELQMSKLPMSLFSLRSRAQEPALSWLAKEISYCFQ